MAISPWKRDAHLISPDGSLEAVVPQADEVAMSAPNIGELEISNGIRVDRVNPSMVWSDDSRHLAIPVWTKDRFQQLVIVSMEDRKVRTAPGRYRVLELERFEGGVVYGVDSPIHKPVPLAFDIAELEE